MLSRAASSVCCIRQASARSIFTARAATAHQHGSQRETVRSFVCEVIEHLPG